MKIQDVKHQHPPFDVASGLGHALITQGTHEAYKSVVLGPVPNTKWSVRSGPRIEDYQGAPYIYATCDTCGSPFVISGPNSHKQTIRHCWASEQVPEHIAAEFVKQRNAFDAKHKKKSTSAPGAPSAFDLQKDRRVEELKEAGVII